MEDFPKNKRSADGRHWYCKLCHLSRGVESDTRLHGSARDRHLKRRYGLTGADVDAMFTGQGGMCAICREAPAIHVDHDHATGKVRGGLCFNCNQGLGNFRDRGDVMELAIDYLQDHDPELGELRETTTARLQALNVPVAIETARATLAS